MKPIEILHDKVMRSADGVAETKGFNKESFREGAAYALRYFREYHMLEQAHEINLLKMREARLCKKKSVNK